MCACTQKVHLKNHLLASTIYAFTLKLFVHCCLGLLQWTEEHVPDHPAQQKVPCWPTPHSPSCVSLVCICYSEMQDMYIHMYVYPSGNYMQMMNALKPIAFDVLECLSQLFDYYLFAVSKHVMALSRWSVYTCTCMYMHMYMYMCMFMYMYIHLYWCVCIIKHMYVNVGVYIFCMYIPMNYFLYLYT